MKHLLSLIILLACSSIAFSQNDCVLDVDGNCIAKGKTKKINGKTSYGAKTVSFLRVDEWQFFSNEGQKVCDAFYIIRSNISYRNGEWTFYNLDNNLFFKRVYNYGSIVSTFFLDTGTYIYGSDTIIAKSDSLGNLHINETNGTILSQYKSSISTLINGDPQKEAKKQLQAEKLAKYENFNDSSFLLKYPACRASLNVKSIPVSAENNLISNGNFEFKSDQMKNGHYSQIEYNNENLAKYWGSSNETPDIYKDKDNCYAGFRVLGVNYECLRNELKKPLSAGKRYTIQFQLKLRRENAYAFNGISVVTSEKIMFFKSKDEGQAQGVVIQSHPSMVLGCRETWMTISGSFVAIGNEKFIYIGNFTDNKDLKLFQVFSTGADYIGEIYYLIDNVVLIEEVEGVSYPCNTRGCTLDTIVEEKPKIIVDETIYSHPKIGQSIVLRNIRFATSSWEILPESYETLDSIVEFMQKYPSMVVEISGHTDNRGKANSNIELSQNRAASIVNFLIENGIEAERMQAKGYGQEHAIDSNETETGRFNNRRVEFKILEL
jgi:outer membrane protein OmpA-like peptidoglycan-associated protein